MDIARRRKAVYYWLNENEEQWFNEDEGKDSYNG